jgi:hypothetical protein
LPTRRNSARDRSLRRSSLFILNSRREKLIAEGVSAAALVLRDDLLEKRDWLDLLELYKLLKEL